MNEGSAKKILFNKSTLFSLKAELARKREEVNEKKNLPQHKLENFKPSVKEKSHEKQKDGEPKKTFKDSLKAIDTEELEACRKAKLALEKKAELYEHLSDSAGNSQLAGRFLVDFNTKKQQEIVKPPEVNVENVEESTVSEERGFEDDSEWTEFTDCLGRTRKCHKSDLKLFVQRDIALMKAINRDKENENTAESTHQEPSKPVKEKPLLVQTTHDYLNSLREKWEQKEKELLAKDKDIHYQDLLFDEARIHGVGYFNFSTDETERRKQMEELIKMREETLKAQKEAEEVRKKREEMIAARVAAARARQRARAGLPPEEPKDPNQKDFTTCLLEFLTQQKNEADAKAKEKEMKLKEEQEKERQKLREAYVREWDIGKEGVEGKLKKFREMTQEEYVEQQRDKRIEEFAPPQSSTSSSSAANVFDDKGNIVGAKEEAPKTWAEVRPKVKTPPPPEIGDLSEISQQKGLFFSTQAKKHETVTKMETNRKSETVTRSETVKKPEAIKYRNFVKPQEPTPIVDELEGIYSLEESKTATEKRKHESNSVEVPPPPTFEYYGPTTIKQIRYEKPFESDIREAYNQGKKSLATKPSNRQLPQHYDFTFD